MTTIAQYLLSRLHDLGVDHIFGVPGDYVLRFFGEISKSPIRHVGTTREDTAAFAADGYARSKGVGALAVTYGVGALNVVNAVAGAYAESSPVVVISGAPGVREQREDPLIHHRFGPFSFQREIFERITCSAVALDDPLIAFRQIDRTLSTMREACKPVYIELPRDIVTRKGYPIPSEQDAPLQSDPETLEEAAAETLALLGDAASPVVIAGVEVHRQDQQDALINFISRSHLPVAATLTGKSVFAERHPAYLGIYEGAMSSEYARYMVEQSDLLLMLGVTLNDVDLGIYTARLDPRRMVRAAQGEVVIRHHRYPHIRLADFLAALTARIRPCVALPDIPAMQETERFPAPSRAMTVARLVQRLNAALTPDMVVVSDTGDCLFAAIELRVHEKTEFLASAFYTTMGFAVPAALGAQIARPDRRVLVLVGDGAFQMTGCELSTFSRLGLAPIVVVFNNSGYSTERFILDGPFNDIASWRYYRIGELFGPLAGYRAATEEEFEAALVSALKETDQPSVIDVILARDDASPAMRRMAEHLRAKM
jgi:TPP-dependent 2-oxoacid decarboxylase